MLLLTIRAAAPVRAETAAAETTPAPDWPTAIESWLGTTDNPSSNPLSLYIGGIRLTDVAYHRKRADALDELLSRRWSQSESAYKEAVVRYAAPIFKILDGNALRNLEYPVWNDLAPSPFELQPLDRDRVLVLVDMMILSAHGWVESMNVEKSALFYDAVLDLARNLSVANTALDQRLIALEIRVRAFRQYLWCVKTISLPDATEYAQYLRILPEHVELAYPLRETVLETIDRDVRWPLTHAADLLELGATAPKGAPDAASLAKVKDRVPELLLELRDFVEPLTAALNGSYSAWRAFDLDDRLERLDPFLRERLPDVREARVREAWAAALARLAVAATAAHHHRRITGDWPSGLDALGLEPALLEDPFSGKPLLYRLGANGPLIYSVGPDGRDEEGAQTWTPERGFLPATALGDVLIDMR